MCTLSVLPLPDGLIVAMNRDESRARPLGGGFAQAEAGGLSMAWPRDVEGGGTWFGVNSAGLIVALLNHFGAGLEPRPKSRGLIPPALLVQRDAEAAMRAASALHPKEYRAFRVVIISAEGGIHVAESDGEALTWEHRPFGPFLLASSGRREREVRAWRWRRFASFLAGRPDLAADAADRLRALHFSRHDPDPGLGFAMERPEALTVSYSEVEIRDSRVCLRHLEEPPRHWGAERRAALLGSTVVLPPRP